MAHIAYMRFAPDKSSDASLLTGARTYSFQWQTRYFLKQYILIDPVIAHGSKAVLPFDWEELPRDDPAIQAFFADAVNHGVGCNGISVPVRNRRGVYSVGVLYEQSFEARMGRIQKEQYGKASIDLGSDRFCRQCQS